ncbi:MAG: CDP-alcohol phosphatidyltransferase family protein [Verrucomicrobiota bacterium]
MSDGDGYSAAAGRSSSGVNCYSDGEGEFMQWSQDVRGRWLRPGLRWMAQLGVRANHVTFASMLAGLAFCPVFLWGSQPLAFGLLFLHVLLDGLDGPLARFRGTASNRGSFTDTMADQLVVTATAVTMIHAGFANVWPGGLYVFFYAVVVAFAFARNALDAPYSWLFRPRFVIFAWFVVEVYWLPGTLDWALWAASAILAFKTLTGFLTIRRKM